MANYSLVVNSKFQPFSFERYIQPYQMYGEAYKEVENALGELAAKANVWEEMANEQTDPYAYKMYKTYANDLESRAGQLEREGLNASSRKDMLNMRARYAKEIIPIESAYKKREEDIARQKKVADATGGRTVFTRDARTTSLDKYMEGIDDYGQTNLDELYKEGAAGGAAISKRYLSTREGQLFNGMYLNLQRTTGMTNGQIQQFLANKRDAKGNLLFPELHALKNELLSKSNYQNYSVADQNRMEQAILSGINTGIIYNVEDKPMENWRAKIAAQKGTSDTPTKSAINPLNVYSSRELNKEEKKYNKDIEDFSQYFYKENGQWKMNQEGWKAYNSKIYIPGVVSPLTGIPVTQDQYVDSDFKRFIDGLGGKGAVSSNNYGPNQAINVGKLWDKYVNNNPTAKTAKYDATKVTEFDYSIDSSQQSDMKDAIMTASRGLSLKEVDYNNKSGTFEDTGEEVTMEDLKKDKYKVTNTRFSPYGTTVMIQDDKGNVRRFRMPPGINITNEQNRDARMEWVKVLQDNRQGGTIRIPDSYAKLMNLPIGTTITATPEKIQDEYNKAVEEAYLFHSQLLVQNKTNEQKYYPYGY